MLLAMDEVGGTKAWARFFASYRDSVEALREIEALPAALGKLDLPPQAALASGAGAARAPEPANGDRVSENVFAGDDAAHVLPLARRDTAAARS
jgi:hypothetical protein